MQYIEDTQANCIALGLIVDKLFAYPSKGVHVGGGRHVEMTNNPASPGWTVRHANVRKHPDRDEWAYPWDGPIAAAMADPEMRSRCTGKELGLLTAAAALAIHLDSSWDLLIDV